MTKRELTAEESKALRVWRGILNDPTLPPSRHLEAQAAIHAIEHTGPLAPVYEQLDELKQRVEQCQGGEPGNLDAFFEGIEEKIAEAVDRERDARRLLEDKVDALKVQVEALAFALGGQPEITPDENPE